MPKLDSKKMSEGISRILGNFVLNKPIQEIFDEMLQFILDLTESEYGFIGEVLNDGEQDYLKTHAITNIAWNDATRKFYEENAPQGLEFKNLKTLFGKVITTGEPVISNSPYTDPRRGGLPEGHPHMGAFLGLPFFFENIMTGNVGIANRAGGYDEELVQELQPVLTACANLIQGQRMVREKNEATEHLKRTVDELQEQNDRLNEFTYVVSHDVKKHTSNLKLMTDILKQDLPSEQKEKASDMLYDSVDHLNLSVNYISEIIDVSRGAQIESTNVNLVSLVNSVLSSQKINIAKERISLNLPKELHFFAPSAYLVSIIENLVTNAIKFSTPGEECVSIALNETDQDILITISDKGLGMDLEKDSDKIFEQFTTLRKHKGSKGLGLFLVKTYVERMNGRIELNSEIGVGTTFKIILPK